MTLSAIRHGTRNRYFSAMACAWSLIEATFVFESLSFLFLSPDLYLVSWYTFCALGFFMLLMSDSLSRDTIDPVKPLLFLAMISVGLVVTALTIDIPDLVFTYTLKDGSRTIFWNENYNVFNYLIYFTPRPVFYYNSARIVRDAPKTLKKQAILMLVGVIVTDSSFVAYMQLKL
ncbi:MAG: hypothetical protein JW839_23010 [Candidatus Lokiarchaeota archaeon]|nr:hypothetical protein [Candidatus Lokiarchaeota archaeon]